jgi:hypothetical protein
VRAQNLDRLGEATDLSTFLFGSPRAALGAYQPILIEVQKGECFYCRRRLRGPANVDHFVPWSRYPTDLAHNFVLAHGSCNRWKSDHLAARPHLDRWIERNDHFATELEQGFRAGGMRFDSPTSKGIAYWAYGQVERIGGTVWLEGDLLVELATGWEHLFLRGMGIYTEPEGAP